MKGILTIYSGLAISRKLNYKNDAYGLPALSGGQKKEGPKWLLRAFTIHSPK